MPEFKAETEPVIRLVKSRRAAREQAFLALYQMDIEGSKLAEVLEDIKDRQNFTEDALNYAVELVEGAINNRREIEMMIIPLLKKDWRWSRIAKVDRAILRIAVYELLFVPELSPKISINEAVNFAKMYGTLEGAKFVNGLLGKLLPQTAKANWAVETGKSEPELEPIILDEPYQIALSPEDETAISSVDIVAKEPVDGKFQIGNWIINTLETEPE